MSYCDHYYNSMSLGSDILLGERYPLTCDDYNTISYYCCLDHVENSRYEAPMPWIGIYVAAASLVCSLAMAADVFLGFRHRKLWFPCKFFTLNAASLTLLTVSMKLPMDLNTDMQGDWDQLAKLGNIVMMSTTMGNFLPSLGTMNDKEIFVNITTLAILVITIFVNISIQLQTRLIDPFFEREYIAAMSFMLLLLVLLSFSALTVSTTKKSLQLSYDDICKTISSEESEGVQNFTFEKLKENVKKYWMMAETSSPQFVMARSVTCYASGIICFLAVATLAEATVRKSIHYYVWYRREDLYLARSGYRWSTFVLLLIQTFEVVVGTIALAFRWFMVIRLRCSKKRVQSYKTELKTENYWIKRLVGWRDNPLALRLRGQKWRKLVHTTKNLILNFFIQVQITIVTAIKLNLLISIFLVSTLMSFGHSYKVLKQKLGYCKPTTSNNHREPESGPGTTLDLSRYVIYLEGEEELPLQIMKNNRDATNHLIQKGKKQ